MREIKFRVWDDHLNCMLYNPELILNKNKYSAVLCPSNILTLVTEELLQYTGLQDKNGVDIYEGDIVTILDPYDDNLRKEYLGQIKYNQKICTFEIEIQFKNCRFEIARIGEVIGNIYENPELLNRGENL